MQVTIANVSSKEFSLADLLEAYNALRPDAPIRRFADRKTAIRRLTEVFEAQAQAEETLHVERSDEVETEENAANVRSFAFGDSSEVAENPNKAAFIFPKAIDFIDAVTPKLPPVMENADKWVIDAKPAVDIFSLAKVESVEVKPIYRVFYRTEVDGVDEDWDVYSGEDNEEAKKFYEETVINAPFAGKGTVFLHKDGEEVWSDGLESKDV